MSLFTTLIPNRARAVRSGGGADAAAPTVKPYFEVREADDAYRVAVYLPGVTKENLEITVEADEFRVSGRRAWKQPEGWTALHRESADEAFELALSHDNAVDAEKVTAELRDGVLQVVLPKHEAVKPRKIAVS
jgi:HSP20 family molecular chaperone IbpA